MNSRRQWEQTLYNIGEQVKACQVSTMHFNGIIVFTKHPIFFQFFDASFGWIRPKRFSFFKWQVWFWKCVFLAWHSMYKCSSLFSLESPYKSLLFYCAGGVHARTCSHVCLCRGDLWRRFLGVSELCFLQGYWPLKDAKKRQPVNLRVLSCWIFWMQVLLHFQFNKTQTTPSLFL